MRSSSVGLLVLLPAGGQNSFQRCSRVGPRWRSKSRGGSSAPCQENTESNIVTYTLLNIDSMINEEGGRVTSAIRGALVIADGCLKRGPPWVKISSQSGRLLFRYPPWGSDFRH